MTSKGKKGYDQAGVKELLLQALETERGGIKVYTTALKAAINDDLRKEWQEYLDELTAKGLTREPATRKH